MIFITAQNEMPLFRARVNGVTEKQLPKGGKITTVILSTTEKDKDGTPKYSSWFANMMGQARKNFEADPLAKGDYINVFSFKQTNVGKKNDDGTFDRPFFNFTLNNYEKHSFDDNGSATNYAQLEDSPY